jgi:hypothetical protein
VGWTRGCRIATRRSTLFPADEGLIFFVQNRGSTCGIWRMKLVAGSERAGAQPIPALR